MARFPFPPYRVQYMPCRGCGEQCDRAGEATRDEPCWGSVVFDILPATPDCASSSRHVCLGHAEPGCYMPLRLAPVDPARACKPAP